MSINLLAVAASAIASLLLGFLWYTVVFRQPYLDGLGKTTEELARGPSTLQASIMHLVGAFVMAYILTWFIGAMGQPTVTDGLRVGALVWLGFIAAAIGPMYAFQAFSFQFFAISTGYHLVALLIMGAILGQWGIRQ